MSGIEIAGIILGTIPLVISGLEHYGEGVRMIRKFRHSSREFLRLKRILQTENDIFLNSIEILLRDDVSHQALAAMLLEVNDLSGWKDPQLERSLQTRLGRSYTTYFSAVETLAQAVTDLRLELQLNVAGKGPFVLDQWSIKDSFKRAKFTLKISTYMACMNEITAQNDRIHRLTRQFESLEPLRELRKPAPDLEEKRRQARSIFEALQNGLTGSCSAGHKASLYMRPGSRLSVKIMFQHEVVVSSTTQLPWVLEEAEIRTLDLQCNALIQPTGSLQIQLLNPPTLQLSNPPATSQHTHAREVTDLCQSLKAWRSTQVHHDICLGYICDDFKLCRHGLLWPRQPLLDQPTATALTLDHIINQRARHSLNLLERRSLAVGLAAGMLGLYDTPWLGKQWGKSEILLLEHAGGLDVENVFISATVAHTYPALPPTTSYFTPCQPIREQTVFALGILLIELALESSFDDLKIAEDAQFGVQNADFTTADRLVDKVYHVAGPRYGDVVRRCIRCDFDHRVTDLKDAGLREKVYAGVVAELRQEVENLKA